MASSHHHHPPGNPFAGAAGPHHYEESGSDASFAPGDRRDTFQSEGSVAELIPTQNYDGDSYEGGYNDVKYAQSAESRGGGGFGPGPGSYAPSGMSSPHTDVRVACDDRLVTVTAQDDGGVVTVPLTTGSGRGLIGMRERVRLAGGQLVECGPTGGGFRVTARLPHA